MNRFIYFLLLMVYSGSAVAQMEPDKPFRQAVSVKYMLNESLKGTALKKVVTDYNDNVYVLSDKGVLRVSNNQLVKDLRFTPLAYKIPVDITAQERYGYLYYLYSDHLLSNAHAGKPYADFPDGKYLHIAVSADGTVLLAGDNALALV